MMPNAPRIALFLVAALTLLVAGVPFAGAPAQSQEIEAATPAATPRAREPGAIDDLTGVVPLPLSGARSADFQAFIAETMTKCPVPGASVVVVQDGAVVFLQGFGVRQMGRSDPVTPHTLMRIGSVTKSFTALLAATLVDSGRVTWDTLVQELLPAFTLADPKRGTRVTLAELFSAASGLPRRDLEFIFEADAYSPAGLLEAMRRLPLTAPAGERYQYSNQAFAAGGYAAAVAAGAAPEDLLAGYQAALQHHVLNPVGMTHSTFVLDEVLRSGDYATPHAPNLAGTTTPLSLLEEDRFAQAVTPAVALWSSAEEMGAYLQTLLAGGVSPAGGRVVSTGQLQLLWRPGVAVSPNPQLPPMISTGMAHYGLGWFIGQYGGLTLINHSGGTYGFASEVALLPEANLGIAVLANDAICGAMLSYAAQYRLFEIVFDQTPAVAAEFDAFLGAVEGQRAAAVALLGQINVDNVAPLLGAYAHPDLGQITFRLDDGAFLVDAGELRSRLAPLRLPLSDEVRYVALDPPLGGAPGWITFEPGDDGRLTAVLTSMREPGEEPLVYRFAPLSAMPPAAATPTP